jgi:hypothetical protein
MSEDLVVQGRRITPADLEQIRDLRRAHPEWSRRRLSEALTEAWDWRNPAGRLKDMATRSLLVKLEARGLIELPERRQRPYNRMGARPVQPRLWDRWDRTPLTGSLGEIGPLSLQEVSGDRASRAEVAAALAEFHYLGYRGAVGENLQYTVSGPDGRLLACLVFGAAAWKCQARDEFIGWSHEQRAARLPLLANNSRFLILPFVQVPHLASWMLGAVLRRLCADWENKYGHPIVLAETFVDRARFQGTCYRAANWIRQGSTTGRTRQDRYTTLKTPIKDIYLYPLRSDFRDFLCV